MDDDRRHTAFSASPTVFIYTLIRASSRSRRSPFAERRWVAERGEGAFCALILAGAPFNIAPGMSGIKSANADYLQ